MDLYVFFIQFRIHDFSAEGAVRMHCYDSPEFSVHERTFKYIFIIRFPESVCCESLL